MQSLLCKPVKYVDHSGVEHDALVTSDWRGANEFGALNIVYVTNDIQKHDSYGNQIERDTSVPHKSNQTAPGNYWYLPTNNE